MFNLTPKKEDKFYKLFSQTSEIAYKASNMLLDFIRNLDNAEENLKAIKDMEHKADEKQHELLKELNQSFITPIDREDIYQIAKGLDDIIDLIEATASRFVMLNVTNSTIESENLAELIIKCCREVIDLMGELKKMKTSKVLPQKIVEINRLEEEGDIVSRSAIKQLFRSDLPVIEIIKWKEIYSILEDTLDACEDVANAVEGVVMKNA